MLQREKIIILRVFPFQESDLIVKGLNTKGVQMSFIAKGALKSKKRFIGGVLEPASFIEVEYRVSKNSLHRLLQAWFLNDFHKLRSDYDRLQLVFYILKVVGIVSLEEMDDSEELFHLVGNTFLEMQTSEKLEALKLFFQVKLLFLQGVLPQEFYRQEILSQRVREHTKFNFRANRSFALQVNEILQRYLAL